MGGEEVDDVLPEDDESPLFAGPPALEYRSEYQPPPFKMKPLPPEIWRLAVCCWHFGQSSSGASVIRWIASQA